MSSMRQEFDFAACCLSEWRGDPLSCRWCDEPLPRHRITSHPSVFCTPTCTWEWKQQHVWAAAKRHRARADKWLCQSCGEKHPLHQVHHIHPCEGNRYPSCLHHQANLLTLCPDCHADQHRQVA